MTEPHNRQAQLLNSLSKATFALTKHFKETRLSSGLLWKLAIDGLGFMFAFSTLNIVHHMNKESPALLHREKMRLIDQLWRLVRLTVIVLG